MVAKTLAAFCALFSLFCVTSTLAQQGAESEGAEQSAEVVRARHFAMRGQPRYQPDFEHFDYVNPAAPKGGELRLAERGTFDSFNRYASQGDPEVNTDNLFGSLMVTSADEIDVFYPLIAESLEYPDNYRWVVFHLNPNARAQDGEPLSADDVVFTFDKFANEGVPFVQKQYEVVTGVKALDEHTVRFDFAEGDKDLIARMASLPILPEHYWQDHRLDEPLDKPPLGSGPYRIGDYKMGQYVVYERVEDYWAQDLPSQQGLNNFDRIRYDYYRDSTVALEAFKAGEFDFRQEHIAKQWAESYQIPAVEKGRIVKEALPHDIPRPMQGFVFNTTRPVFEDRRVRQALTLMLDFQWMNKNLFYSSYQRNVSYFENTPYKAKGEPSEAELAILEPFRDQLPEAVFGPAWRPQPTEGNGNIRPRMRRALGLLKQAGWKLEDRKLVNAETGEPFEFQMLMHSPSMERVVLPYKENLARIGIELSIRMVDTSQYLKRLRSRDFDMTPQGYSAMAYPSPFMETIWHSDYIDSTYNQAGVDNPVIDALVEGILANQENESQLLAYGRAFDRVAMWQFYVVPHWHSSEFRIAYWNKFSRPETRPKYAIGIDSWWYDATKAKALKQ